MQERTTNPGEDVSIQSILARSVLVAVILAVLLGMLLERHRRVLLRKQDARAQLVMEMADRLVEPILEQQRQRLLTAQSARRQIRRIIQRLHDPSSPDAVLLTMLDLKGTVLAHPRDSVEQQTYDALTLEAVGHPHLLATEHLKQGRGSFSFSLNSERRAAYVRTLPGLDSYLSASISSPQLPAHLRSLWWQLSLLAVGVFLLYVVAILYYARVTRLKNETLLLEIEERRVVEDKLRVSEARFDLAVAGSSQGLWDLDILARELWVDESSIEDLGFEVSRTGWPMSLYELVHEEDRTLLRKAFQSHLVRRKPFDVTIRVESADRDIQWLKIRGQAVWNKDGVATRMAGSFMDVTSQRAIEEQLRRAQKMDSLGLLAGGVAHDFNNLLLVILSYSEFALEELPPDHSIVEHIQEIRLAGTRAADLTQQLLAFSRQQVIQPRPLHMNELVLELRGLIKRLIREDITMTYELAEDLGLVKIDHTQTEQVIINLCANARDAMAQGGEITLRTEDVFLHEPVSGVAGAIAPGRYIRLTVEDTGEGMDPKMRERIFEPFFTTKPLGRGTGLGLASVLGIVQQQRGGIVVESEPGQGSTFFVYLPVVEQDPLSEPSDERVETTTRGDETLLVVEDEEMVRALTTRVLERAGYHVLLAEDGARALEVFEEHKDQIDLVLMDVVMPNMGGLEAYERIHDVRASTPVIFCTGYSGGEGPTRFIEERELPILNKPYESRELLVFVRAALEDQALALTTP